MLADSHQLSRALSGRCPYGDSEWLDFGFGRCPGRSPYGDSEWLDFGLGHRHPHNVLVATSRVDCIRHTAIIATQSSQMLSSIG